MAWLSKVNNEVNYQVMAVALADKDGGGGEVVLLSTLIIYVVRLVFTTCILCVFLVRCLNLCVFLIS